MKTLAPLPLLLKLTKSAAPIARSRLQQSRAEIVNEDYHERMRAAVVRRAMPPVEAKAAVNTRYGDLIAVARATGSMSALAPSRGLEVSQPGDKIEQEAERVADHVMRMPSGAILVADSQHAGPSIVQRVLRSPEQPAMLDLPVGPSMRVARQAATDGGLDEADPRDASLPGGIEPPAAKPERSSSGSSSSGFA